MEADFMIPFLPLYDVDFWSGYSFELLVLYEEQYSMLFADFCSASTNELNAIFYIYIGDNTSALNELYKEKHPHKHIQAAICELELRIKGVCTIERDQMLRMFFGKRYVAYIQRNWRDRNTHASFFRQIYDKTEKEQSNEFFWMDKYKSLLTKITRNMEYGKIYEHRKEYLKLHHCITQRE